MLPARVAIADQEALDGFLERLAAVNDLQPSTLLTLFSRPGRWGLKTRATLMVKPDDTMVLRISDLSGIEPNSIRMATLSRFDGGLPLELEGFDSADLARSAHVVAHRWFPMFGTQACPQCLACDGIWRVHWRLPIVAACADHGAFLVPSCAACGRRFRTNPYSPLRTILGRDEPCANPIGRHSPCRHPVVDHRAEPADTPVVNASAAILQALAGQPMRMVGEYVDPRVFLAELRHLATLLLHLVSRPAGLTAVPWAEELHGEAGARTVGRRGPHWSFSPPRSAVVRGSALAEAHEILCQPNFGDAAEALAPFVELISDQGRRVAWLTSRAARTRTMTQLIQALTARRGCLGRRLTDSGASYDVGTQAIPQMIDADIYAETFADMLRCREPAGRLFVSMCLARAVTQSGTWSDAAASIGVDATVGARTADTVRRGVYATPEAFANAVDMTARLLPADRDFRRRESAVRALAEEPNAWFESWCRSMFPRPLDATLPYAVTWMWCEVAQGLLDTSPAWPHKPDCPTRATFRAFSRRLPSEAQQRLRAVVLSGSPPG